MKLKTQIWLLSAAEICIVSIGAAVPVFLLALLFYLCVVLGP